MAAPKQIVVKRTRSLEHVDEGDLVQAIVDECLLGDPPELRQ